MITGRRRDGGVLEEEDDDDDKGNKKDKAQASKPKVHLSLLVHVDMHNRTVLWTLYKNLVADIFLPALFCLPEKEHRVNEMRVRHRLRQVNPLPLYKTYNSYIYIQITSIWAYSSGLNMLRRRRKRLVMGPARGMGIGAGGAIIPAPRPAESLLMRFARLVDVRGTPVRSVSSLSKIDKAAP